MSDSVVQPAVARFVGLAERYCALIRSHDPESPAEWLPRAHALLSELYAAALVLPTPADAPECPPVSASIDEAPFPKVRCRNFYSEFYDPFEVPARPGGYSVSGNLGEIHHDLASGLECWHSGNRDGAVWGWRFGFESHWGRHLANVLHALHWLEFSYGFDLYEERQNG